MSKNITIQEGGVAKQLTADKLKTNLVGGGTCLWVPEDEMTLGTKSINENGTYLASDDGLYGYSQVTVNGIGSATGTIGSGTISGIGGIGSGDIGDQIGAYIDPTTGELTIEKIPSSIEVISPPSRESGVYTDGQTIIKSGMVVKAYYETGGEWGTVNNNELTLTPSVAVYDDSSSSSGGYEGDGVFYTSYVGKLVNNDIVQFLGDINAPEDNRFSIYTRSQSSIGAELCLTQYDGKIYGCTNGAVIRFQILKNNGGSAQTIGPTPVEIGEMYYDDLVGYAGVSEVEPSSGGIDDLTPTWPRSSQIITVSWPRPVDGTILTDTFEITVEPHSQSN